MQGHPQQVLGIVIAMTTDHELWHCYFEDFITYKLNFVDQPLAGDFAQQILNYFEYLDEYDAPRRMAELHAIYQLQVATILRPLIKIGRVRKLF